MVDQRAADPYRKRPIVLYVLGGVVVAAMIGVAYINLSQNSEIATIRQARAAIAERGPRMKSSPRRQARPSAPSSCLATCARAPPRRSMARSPAI